MIGLVAFNRGRKGLAPYGHFDDWRGRKRERERKIPRKYVSDPKSSVATEVVMKL